MNIYMDNNATTGVRDEVLEEMLPFFRKEFGNPSSAYKKGEVAAKAVYRARERVSRLISSTPQEVMFVASGTESDNTAIRGALSLKPDKKQIIISSVEHPAVYKLAESLKKDGYRISIISVDSGGILNREELKRSICEETALISVMYANNETGVISPVGEIGKIAKERGILFHVDAVQAPGKIPVNVKKQVRIFSRFRAISFMLLKGLAFYMLEQG